MLPWAGVTAFLVCAGVLFGVWYSRISRGLKADGTGADHILHFSLERYEVMLRLFDSQDYRWILGHPHGNPEMCRRLRAERRRAFRAYLGELSEDFRRLRRLAQEIILNSPQDESRLMIFLVRQSIRFHYQIAALHVKLLLDPIRVRKIDATCAFGLTRDTHAHLFWLAVESDWTIQSRAVVVP